ncbi:MAG: YigZ family protein [Desulfovibrionaceae bacterium]|nr:YigZ family protein [Desulfovibrionaceae bacterium]
MADFAIPNSTFDHPHETELVIRRSRFLTSTVHVESLAQGRSFVDLLRQKYNDANHNCWACVGGVAGDSGQAAASDDGEPHGTAGKPMLQVLIHSGIGEVCVVVTRWFGGVKLGTGGLVRAYQDSVRENLATLPTKPKRILLKLKFTINYPERTVTERLLAAHEAEILHLDYGSEITFKIALANEEYDNFNQEMANLTNGRVKIDLI